MVNADVLKTACGRFQISPNNACEFHKHLFTMHPEIAVFYDAEDLDPEKLVKSRKFMQIGIEFLRIFLNLPAAYGTDGFEGEVSHLIGHFKEDFNMPFAEFKVTAAIHKVLYKYNTYGPISTEGLTKYTPVVHSFFEESAGGCSDEEKAAWTEFMDEVYQICEKKGYQ